MVDIVTTQEDRDRAVGAVNAIVADGFAVGCCLMSETDGHEFAAYLSDDFARHRLTSTAELTTRVAEQDAEIARLRAQVEGLLEALEPSGDTKAAYMGEFHFPIQEMDEEGVEYVREQYVPWTVIKEIMAAISARAVLENNHED